jgi:hypothetical protein
MSSKGTCKVGDCTKDVRGKGYCDRHYRTWRRGKLPKPRYRSCNTAGCNKPVDRRALCTEHFQGVYAKAKAAVADEAAPPSATDGGESTATEPTG